MKIQKKIFTVLIMSVSFLAFTQNLEEKINLKLYEHHSSTVNNGAPFGSSANGIKSGYDFVNHAYFNSFEPVNSGPYVNGEELNIDMVEHNGPYFGSGRAFGFTSGISSIWNGSIKGNNSSLWVLTSNSFNYSIATSVIDLVNEYNAGTPSNFIDSVQENGVYISKIRNSNLYVAVKCYDVTNNPSQSQNVQDVCFSFDYKYGVLDPTLEVKEKKEIKISIYPNPSSDFIYIESQFTYNSINIYSFDGSVSLKYLSYNTDNKIDVRNLNPGVYILSLILEDGTLIRRKFIKN